MRNTLKALYRFGCEQQKLAPENIRPVKLETLEPESWTPAEIIKLVLACDRLPYCDRNWWRTFVLAGFYSGLNACDLHRLERKDIGANGGVPFIRSKTGKRVFFSLPMDLVAEIIAISPAEGPIWPLLTSQESFRKRFERLVRLAGIRHGTFKKLRKTSGTLVEAACPGAGHRHLGNEQAIFSKHYEDRRVTQSAPTSPAAIDLREMDAGAGRRRHSDTLAEIAVEREILRSTS